MQTKMSGRRVVVLRLPTRRLASAFVGFGALTASARLYDDALDWSALQSLPSGTKVHWRKVVDGRAKGFTGTVDTQREIGGSAFLAIRIDGSRRGMRGNDAVFLLPKVTALSYGVTLGTVSAKLDQQLTQAAKLFEGLVGGRALPWLRSFATDSTAVTERSTFVNDLSGLSMLVDGKQLVSMTEALAITDAVRNQHGKFLLVPARSELVDAPHGVTILDGPLAITRLGDSSARSIVAILEHSEYDEGVAHTLNPFFGRSAGDGLHIPDGGVSKAPPGTAAFAFALPEKEF